MTNVFVALKRLLPAPTVVVGTVVEHHAEDDTSTLEVPASIALVPFDQGLSTGNRIRARGRSVAIGQRAFVRNGVVETEAPSGDIVDITVGRVVPEAATILFSGTVPPQAWHVGVPVLLNLASYFRTDYRPVDFSIDIALPAGVSLNPTTGAISGTPSAVFGLQYAIVTGRDAMLAAAPSNAFAISVAA